MKKIVLCALATLVIFGFLYGVWAFCTCSFNPAEWREEGRVMYCFAAFFLSAFACIGIGVSEIK